MYENRFDHQRYCNWPYFRRQCDEALSPFEKDINRQDLINISNTSLKLSGLGNAIKLESIDVTNIQNAVSLDGLENLLNIRKVYAKGTSISNFTFADGAMIEKLELPKTTESLKECRIK